MMTYLRHLRIPAMMAALLLSAFSVVASTHACRGLYAQLQGLEAKRWYLEEEYSRLLLEQSTWASHHRIERVAGEELELRAPSLSATRQVKR
jgi:cell division protein FtsL